MIRRTLGPLALVLLGVTALAAVVALGDDPRFEGMPGTMGRVAVTFGLMALTFGAGEHLYEVHGTVVNSETNLPIANARVISTYPGTGVSEARTNTLGEFMVHTVWDNGDAPLEVAAPGYMTKVATGGDHRGHRTITLIPESQRQEFRVVVKHR